MTSRTSYSHTRHSSILPTTTSTSASSATASTTTTNSANKQRQYTHLHAQLAQLNAHLADTENLVRMTAVQALDMRFLGGYVGALMMGSGRVLGEGVGVGGSAGAGAGTGTGVDTVQSEEDAGVGKEAAE